MNTQKALSAIEEARTGRGVVKDYHLLIHCRFLSTVLVLMMHIFELQLIPQSFWRVCCKIKA